jgi:rhodanese-related sulfurtransferase
MFGFLNPNRSASRPDPKVIVERVAKGEITLVDVRDISELKSTGKAAGAIHVPLMLLQSKADPRSPEHIKALATDKPVALYCASGARSGMAAGMFQRLGYAEVINLGGLYDWKAAGGQIVPA